MKAKLNELAQITVGQIMNRVEVKSGEKTEGNEKDARVLIPSAISGGTVRRDKISSARLKKTVPLGKITKNGDIVIKLTSPYDCALITENDEDLVVPSYCAIIRDADTMRVDKRYLTGYLNSAYTLAKLTAGINASALAMVRAKSLEELEIELPDMALQNAAGNAYWASCKKKCILEMMAEQQQRISEAVIIETLKEVKESGRNAKNDAE